MFLIEELRDAMIEREVENYVSINDDGTYLILRLLQDSLTKNDYEEHMIVHLQLYDYQGAAILFERYSGRFEEDK